MSNGFALSTELLVLPVGSELRLNNVVPSVQSHYRTFLPTTDHSVPVSRIGTLVLADLPLGRLPLHRDDRFSRSIQEPDLASRRLNAGCRPGNFQVCSRARPGGSDHPRFRHQLRRFDTSSTVRSRSPLQIIPAEILSRLFCNAHHGRS